MGFMLGTSCSDCCCKCESLPDTITITIPVGAQGLNALGQVVDVCACDQVEEAETYVLARVEEEPCKFRHVRCPVQGSNPILPLVFAGAGGFGAVAYAVVDNPPGPITAIRVCSGGNYPNGVTVSVGGPTGIVQPGSGAELEAVLTPGNAVTGVTIVDGGDDYISCGGPPGSVVEYEHRVATGPVIRSATLGCSSTVISVTPPTKCNSVWFESPTGVAGPVVEKDGEYDAANIYPIDCCVSDCMEAYPCCQYSGPTNEGPWTLQSCRTVVVDCGHSACGGIFGAGCFQGPFGGFTRYFRLPDGETCEDCPPQPQTGRCCSFNGDCRVDTEACCVGTWFEDETCDDAECADQRDECQVDGDCGEGFCIEDVGPGYMRCTQCRDNGDCDAGWFCVPFNPVGCFNCNCGSQQDCLDRINEEGGVFGPPPNPDTVECVEGLCNYCAWQFED
jgi:hypothetical protein